MVTYGIHGIDMEFIKINNDWRESQQYVKVENVWRKVSESYVKVDNEWKLLVDPDIPDGTIRFNNTSTGRSGSIQTWVVPATGVYRIKAYGAQGGGNSSTNRGALSSGEFYLEKGQVINILVGQRGTINDTRGSWRGWWGRRSRTNSMNYHVGGGGGTFVVTGNFSSANYSDILTIAGGGGGILNNHNNNNAGGTRGSHGRNGSHAGRGVNGGNGRNSNSVVGGKGFASTKSDPNGVCCSSYGGSGGYGGGGGVTGGWWNRAGGGGGYSGGGAGGRNNSGHVAGGGGGSLSRGANSVLRSNVMGGHGRVDIDYIRRFF